MFGKKGNGEVERLQQQIMELQAELAAATEKAEQAKKKYQEAVDNPKIPPKKLDEIRKEAAEKAKAAATKEGKAALEAAEKKALAAESKLKAALNDKVEAELDLQEAREKLKKANPDVAAFGALFEQVQKTVRSMKEKINAIQEVDRETADKLRRAMSAFGASLQSEVTS